MVCCEITNLDPVNSSLPNGKMLSFVNRGAGETLDVVAMEGMTISGTRDSPGAHALPHPIVKVNEKL